MNPTNQNTSGMDQQVINLAKAIRQHESGGNFNAKGASNESGAYQWTPDTWKAHATEALGNGNAEMTRDNQQAVAYTIMKKWKDQGLNPAQIAAKWNSGSESGWENKVGVNKFGVRYDVPAYVKSVTDFYQQYKAETESPMIQAPQQNVPTVLNEAQAFEQNNFFESLVKDPIKTLLVKPLTRFGQAAMAGYGSLTGNDELADKAYDDVKLDIPLLGRYYIEGQKAFGDGGATQILGDALNSASYIAPAGAAERAGASLFKGQVGKAAGSGALAGAQYGALAGAGQALGKDDPTLGTVLQDAAIGGVAGGLGGATLGLAGGIASKGVRGAVDLTSHTKQTQKLGEQFGEILNLTPKQTQLEERFAKDTPAFLARELPDANFKLDTNGRLDTSDVVQDLKIKYEAENQVFDDLLKSERKYVDLDELAADAKK